MDDLLRNKRDLISLLSHDPITSWEPIFRRIQDQPNEARELYYRNESCLQLALKATEQNECSSHPSPNDDITCGCIRRIDVLKAIVNADPHVIHWRDDEGRTALHTACSAGRSFEVLQWLLEVENDMIRNENPENLDSNATLRTDFPGGALPLHSIAACSSFDDSYFRMDHIVEDSMYVKCLEHFERCPVQVKITPHIMAAYASTTTIIQANPKAIWDRDCEGELPLHSAASLGHVGCVLALLAASDNGQAQTLNDRQKSPLSCACERIVAFSVHRKEDTRTSVAIARRSEINSLRVSVDRDDPFRDWSEERLRTSGRTARPFGGGNLNSSTNELRGLGLRESISGWYGASVRSSFTSSFVLSGGRFGVDQSGIDPFRVSCSLSRRPVHPVTGLDELDEDVDEEFLKVELLARAACGVECDFHLLHELIKLDQPPEVVWQAACKNPFQVSTRDELSCTPLHLACERLVRAMSEYSSSNNSVVELEGASEHSIAGGSFSLNDFSALNESSLFASAPRQDELRDGEVNTSSQSERLSIMSRNEVSTSTEIINMLLCSNKFGDKEMASVRNRAGRMPLHIILEAVTWTDDGDEHNPNPVKSLIDAYPRALESRDGLTGLYPFMIPSTNQLLAEEEGLSITETTYRLLVDSPAVISLDTV